MSRLRDDQDGRGRHKKHVSPETRRWRETVEAHAWLRSDHVPGRAETSQAVRGDPRASIPVPRCPPWLDQVTYARLLKLRAAL